MLLSLLPGILAVAVLAAGAGCRPPSTVASAQSAAETLPIHRFRPDDRAFASYSGMDDSLTTVIRDSVEWRVRWSAIHRRMMPQPTLPEVDFAREIVVLAALGARPSGGHEVLVESAAEERDAVTVNVRRTVPGSGCLVTAAFTQPVDVVRIPVRAKPVRFVHLHRTIEC